MAEKREKLPRTLFDIGHQTGSRKDILADAARFAMTPGKRISKNKHIYWETRANRSDAAGKNI